jgi:hypothetical protein
LIVGVVAVLLSRRQSRGVYLVAIASILLGALVGPYFIGSGISVLAAGPGFDGNSSLAFAIPSLAGVLLAPAVVGVCALVGSARARRY